MFAVGLQTMQSSVVVGVTNSWFQMTLAHPVIMPAGDLRESAALQHHPALVGAPQLTIVWFEPMGSGGY